MSRAYRITVKETLKRNLSAADQVSSHLEILEILPPEQMSELLRKELKDRGFAEEDGRMVRSEDGITIRVDPSTCEVVVQAETHENMELNLERDDWGYDDAGPREDVIRDRVQAQLKQDLEKRAQQRQERLQAEASEKLEGKLDDVRKELGKAINRVTAEALKRKAKSLGQIKEMTEDPETGSLTIKVEV